MRPVVLAAALIFWLTPTPAGANNTPLAAWVEFCKRDTDDLCSPREPAILKWTEDTAGKVSRANRMVNSKYPSASDFDTYGVDEYWAVPTEYADCEDYVLAKMVTLRDMGVPIGAMTFLVGEIASTKEGHALLAIHTDQGIKLLDNLTNSISRLGSTRDFIPYKLQTARNLSRWEKQ